MARVLADRVRETTTTTGTGTINLAGAQSGHQTFLAGIGANNTTFYCITDGSNWEVGEGTVNAGTPNTLSRDTVFVSTAGAGTKVNWAAGTRDVFCGLPSSQVQIKGAGINSGTAGSPGLNSETDSDTGLFWIIANILAASTGGVERWRVDANRFLISAGASGTEGGQLELLKPPSGSTLAGNVIVDVVNNFLRFYEGGGSARGMQIDLSALAAGSSSTLWTSSNLDPEQNHGAGNLILSIGSAAAPGSIIAEGGTVSRTTYARLWNKIGTSYGAGDGSTTFTLPDWRGVVFRALDRGRGLDSGRSLGSYQQDAMQNITGSFYAANRPGGAPIGAFYDTGGRGSSLLAGGGLTNDIMQTGIDASRQVRTAAETRMQNIALTACITY